MESDASEACGRKKQWCNCRYLRPKNSVRIDHLRADVSTPDFRSTEHSVGSFLSLMEVLVGAVWRWRLLGLDKSSSGNYFPKFWRNQVCSTSKLREILAKQHTASYSKRIKSSTNECCEKFKISKYIIFWSFHVCVVREYSSESHEPRNTITSQHCARCDINKLTWLLSHIGRWRQIAV